MNADTPDYPPPTGQPSWSVLRAHIKAVAARHRLAQAADSHPEPVRLVTGHFAPPNTYAVWHLPCRVPAFGEQVVQVIARNDGADIALRIVPDGAA